MIWDDVIRLLRLARKELKLTEDYLKDCEYEVNKAVQKLDTASKVWESAKQ